MSLEALPQALHGRGLAGQDEARAGSAETGKRRLHAAGVCNRSAVQADAAARCRSAKRPKIMMTA